MSTLEHDKYFGAESAPGDWRHAYTRVVDLIDRISPYWRGRSIYVGDALHQEIADVFYRVKLSDKELALIKARNAVSQLESDLKMARAMLAQAESRT